MAFEGRQDLIAYYKAAVDLEASQYRFVKLDGNGELVQCDAAGEAGLVLVDKPKAGVHGSLVIAGETKVVAGAAIAALDLVTTDAQGRAITAVTEGQEVLGRALRAVGAAGELVEIVVVHGVFAVSGAA